MGKTRRRWRLHSLYISVLKLIFTLNKYVVSLIMSQVYPGILMVTLMSHIYWEKWSKIELLDQVNQEHLKTQIHHISIRLFKDNVSAVSNVS